MTKLKNYFALLVFLFCIILQHKELYAIDDDIPQPDSAKEQGGGYYATLPECSSGLAEIIIGVAIIAIAGWNFIIPGFRGLISSPSVASQVIAIAKITVGLATIMGTIISMSTSLQCYFAFVQDPIKYAKDDVSTGMLDKNNKVTTKRWEAENVPYSENISVCARPIMIPYLNLAMIDDNIFTGMGLASVALLPIPIIGQALAATMIGLTAGKALNAKTSFSCYNTNDAWDSDDKVYDGEHAFLCPEEWRFHKYKADTEITTIKRDNKDAKIRLAKWFGIEPDSSDEEASAFKNILEMRQHTGPLICENHKHGDKFNIHGYDYSIVKRGAKLCAKLEGLKNFPSISGDFIIGCHYTKPAPPAPMCADSIKIYLQDETGAFVQDAINGGNILIDYDNSACFSCIVGQSCHVKTSSHSLSVMPLSSYIMECLHDTLSNVIFGCQNNPTHKGGMFYNVNEQLKKITYILVMLSIILFGLRILFTNSLPKFGEIMMMVIKIGVVLFFVHGKNEDTGMHWFYNQITSLSSGLGSMLFSATTFRNDICNFQDSDYINANLNSSFLRPFDILDCKIFFYLGGALFGSNSAPNNFWENFSEAIPRLILIIFPLFGLFDPIALMLSIFLFIFAILIISLAIWMTSLMVLSMIMLFFLILIGPLLVPMMLFNYSKSFFDSWIKELFAYALFPPFLFLFLGFTFSIFDIKMFGATKFEPVDVEVLGRKAKHFVFKEITCTESNKSDPRCVSCEKWLQDQQSCDGCDPEALACQMRAWDLKKTTTLWGESNITSGKGTRYFLNLLESFGYIILMAVIFVTSINTIAFLIAKMTGGSRSIYRLIEHGVSPMTAFQKIGTFAAKPAIFFVKKGLEGVKSKSKKSDQDKKQALSSGTEVQSNNDKGTE